MAQIKNIKITDAKPSANEHAQFAEVRRKSTISQVSEPLKEQILKGDVHTIDEMRAWLKPLGYSDTLNEAAINFILREFVMSKVPSDSLCNAEKIVELFRPQLEHRHHTSAISHQPSLRLYHHRDLIGSPSAFTKVL